MLHKRYFELLLPKLCSQQNVPFKILKESVNITLVKHAPLKERYVRDNKSPFMNKNFNKKILKRVTLEKQFFLNTTSDIDRKTYNKQHNCVVSLLKNEMKNFCSNLDTKVVTGNEAFWKTIKPLLPEKVTKHSTRLKTINFFLWQIDCLEVQWTLYKYPNFKYA